MAARTPETLLEQGRAAKREHRPQYARNLFRKALKESRKSEDRALRAALFEELAYVDRNLRDLEAARRHYLQASEIYRSLDSHDETAHTMRHAADILREQGKRDRAEPLYVEALAIFHSQQQTWPLDLANAIRGYALLKTESGDRQQALALWHEARELYLETGIEAGVTECAARIRSLLAD